MFSGLMSSVAMCREQQSVLRESPTRRLLSLSDQGIQPPRRFMRRSKASNSYPANRDTEEDTSAWQEYAAALLHGGETLSQYNLHDPTHRDHALLSRHGEDGVVAPRAPGSRVDEEVDGLIRDRGGWRLGEHDVQVDRAEDLLEGVKGQPTQLALDEVRAVLHYSLQLDVPVATLPPRDEVQHVGALGRLAVLPAGVAGEGDRESGEEREVGGLVPHAEQAREEVDLASDGGDGQEACRPHN
jgi:hypothetical protein